MRARRTTWYASDLRIKNEPLMRSLIEYRLDKDRRPVSTYPPANVVPGKLSDYGTPNLESSITTNGTQMPILDLDFPHHYVPSSTEGHGHLYLDVEMGRLKFTILMLVLWWCGIVEMGNAVWSIRRGANFVRLTPSKTEAEAVKPEYGWFRRLK